MKIEVGDTENVITVDFDPDKERPAFTTKRRRDYRCGHRYKAIDEVLRSVTCRDCEIDIDPLDALLDVARAWEWLQNNSKDIKAKNARARSELDRVDRELRNAKARLRRAIGGDS